VPQRLSPPELASAILNLVGLSSNFCIRQQGVLKF
jgi:hypothetical protein